MLNDRMMYLEVNTRWRHCIGLAVLVVFDLVHTSRRFPPLASKKEKREKPKLQIAGNGKCALRHGWLKKVSDASGLITEDGKPKKIFSSDTAIADFGVGRNMFGWGWSTGGRGGQNSGRERKDFGWARTDFSGQ